MADLTKDYKQAVDKVLWDLVPDVTPTVESDGAVIRKLDLIRMLVKGHQDPLVHAVACAIHGLLLAELPVTDENIRWLIRNGDIGFEKENKLFNQTNMHKVRIYPALDGYKETLSAIHNHTHPGFDKKD